MADKTAYQETLARATLDFSNGDAHVLERIYVRSTAEEEIRWCYYKGGRFAPRPPDLPEEDLLRLFEAAVAEGVFTPRFQHDRRTLADRRFLRAGRDGAHRHQGRGAGGGSNPPPKKIALGRTVPLGRRTRTSGCRRGEVPDRRCSPGAYYSKLTKAVICSPLFSTGTVRDVPQSEKFAVEREYGKAATYYGRSVEIDHIVPLEFGGSNSIANLYFEPGSGKANYRAKDRLENRLHDMVCGGSISLRKARTQIASNWKTLYKKVFGRFP